MNQFERGSETLEQRIEGIALKACEISEIREVIEDSKSKIEAIGAVRVLLPRYFSEISQLPEPEALKEEGGGRFKNPLGGKVLNDFKIAKHVVGLLFNQKI